MKESSYLDNVALVVLIITALCSGCNLFPLVYVIPVPMTIGILSQMVYIPGFLSAGHVPNVFLEEKVHRDHIETIIGHKTIILPIQLQVFLSLRAFLTLMRQSSLLGGKKKSSQYFG